MRPRISIRVLVRRSVGRLVGWSVMLSSKSMKNGILMILNDLERASDLEPHLYKRPCPSVGRLVGWSVGR